MESRHIFLWETFGQEANGREAQGAKEREESDRGDLM
jgi:hypothetical protein